MEKALVGFHVGPGCRLKIEEGLKSLSTPTLPVSGAYPAQIT